MPLREVVVSAGRILIGSLLLASSLAVGAQQQASVARHREFPRGSITRIEDLPPSRLRSKSERLPLAARQRVVEQLRNFHFTDADLKDMDADPNGGVFYADAFSLDGAVVPTESGPTPTLAPVPVSPFPSSLVFHSRPGAPNVLYLNFSGEVITGTAWNDSIGRSVIPAVAFSTDDDDSTFSDAEQTAIKRIWERVAEDYAPFNVDVTTERPATLDLRTAMALITRSTDANGSPNPSSTAGGVSYVNVFGSLAYANYRPSWIYYDNLGGVGSFIAEAASHEIGHNLGLSHDGKTDGSPYYSGHGTGDTSWGPIMGTGYGRNVSQWSKGEYYLANNTQDDIAIIAGKLSYAPDDHGDAAATATPLLFTDGTNVVSTTPENDPDNLDPANKGILEQDADVDVFSFATGNGPIQLNVNPWIMAAGTHGGNLDVLLELYDAHGALVLTNNPADHTTANIEATLPAGIYYLFVRNSGAGDPMSFTPSGYTSYGSLGQYFISGYITAPDSASGAAELKVAANNPAWGSVTPTNATMALGSTVAVQATPAPYCRFVGWTNDASGNSNPITFVVATNVFIQAMFSEITTTNHPTPYAWLAAHGYTNDFETAVSQIGTNGIPLWQSYVAGLNPNDLNSRLCLSVRDLGRGAGKVLGWEPVTGRTYSLWWSTNLSGGFVPVPGASDLPDSVRSFTNAPDSVPSAAFYRLEVRIP